MPERDTGGWPLLLGFMALSALAHVVTIVALPSTAPPRGPDHSPVEMAFYEPPPPPPPKVEEPEPPRELEKPKPKPPVKVETPKPPEEAPPPPNEEPPPTPTKPVPLVIGVTMNSTAVGGSFAVQVGNTTYGKASDKVVDPSEVKPYAAPKYAPPGSADSEPELIGEVKIPYPDEARKNDIEGSVRLKVTLNAQGVVEDVVVISGPGYGLNEAARDALRKFHFKPATKAGEAVGYTFIYTYTFLLD
ncbi:MAG: energy transducer TonB [Myxococcota bacterium]